MIKVCSKKLYSSVIMPSNKNLLEQVELMFYSKNISLYFEEVDRGY